MTKGANKVDLRYSIVRIESENNGEPIIGTGVIVSGEGHIITCNHLVVNPRSISVLAASPNGVFEIDIKVKDEDYFDKSEGDFCLLKARQQLPTHLKPMRLLISSQSSSNHFTSFGFPNSNSDNGVEGFGKIQATDLASQYGYPVFQLEDSNNITGGFSGAPIYDEKLNGIVGIINSGVINTAENRQLGTSFGVAFDFMAPKIKDTYRLNLIVPGAKSSFPYGFTPLEKPSPTKVSPAKIRYQDFLQSNNLPYISRDDYKKKKNISKSSFVTENLIINNLLKSEGHDGGAVIYGEGGVGKTRLMYEIGQRALDLDWIVIKVNYLAGSIADLIPFLSPGNKYLLLFDYIEESKSFHNDIIINIQEHNEDLHIRALVNSRYTFKGSGKFPENFYQIHLADNEQEELNYREFVVQEITKDIVDRFPLENADFFKLKPSFAVFLTFLNYKDGLDNADIREVPDFKGWIKKRFRLTRGKNNFKSIKREVFYLVSALPAVNEQIDDLYGAGYQDFITDLKNDGWIEELEEEDNKVLRSVHDTVVDELLLIHFEIIGKDRSREVRQFFNFSTRFGLQPSWLRSMERIIEHPDAPQKEDFYQLLSGQLSADADSVSIIRDNLGVSSVLDEIERIKLIYDNQSFFHEYITSHVYGNSLSFALNQEKKNEELKEHFRSLFDLWYEHNLFFYQEYPLAYRVISTYINYFGIDDLARTFLDDFLRRPDFASRRETSYVLAAWLSNGGDLDFIEPVVYDYLDTNAVDLTAQYVIAAWLNRGGNLNFMRIFVLHYLDRNASMDTSQYVLAAWLKNGGEPEAVEPYLIRYLEYNAERILTHSVLSGWMNRGGSIKLIEDFVFTYLKANTNTKYLPFSSHVLAAWLNAGGNIDKINPYVIDFLEKNAEDASTSSFVLAAWLKNEGSKGNIDVLRPFVSNFLETNAENAPAQYVTAAWLKSGGDRDFIQDAIGRFLSVKAEIETARHVIIAWLESGGSTEFVQEAVVTYLEKNANDSGPYIFANWLKLGGDPEAIAPFILAHLEENATSVATAPYILEAWLSNKGSLSVIEKYVGAFLEENAEDIATAPFVLAAWLDNEGEPELIRPFVERYLKKNAEDITTQFVLVAWIKRSPDIDFIQPFTERYLSTNAGIEVAQFVLAAWLKCYGPTPAMKPFVKEYLERNAEKLPAQFVLTTWLDAGGDVNFLQPYLRKHLAEHAQEIKSQFVLAAWLKRNAGNAFVRPAIEQYLEKNAGITSAQFVLTAWLDAKGDIDFVHPFASTFFAANLEKITSQFVLTAWLKNGGAMDFAKPLMLRYLEQHAEERVARHIMTAWLNRGGDPGILKEYVVRYLNINGTKKSASYLFQALLDNLKDPFYVKEFLFVYLEHHHLLINSSYHFSYWINKGWDIEEVEEFMLQFLEMHQENQQTGFMLRALGSRIDLKEAYKPYLSTYLLKNPRAEHSSNILYTALKKSESLEWLRPVVTNYLDINIEYSSSQRIIAPWIISGGDEQFIFPFLEEYLTMHSSSHEAHYVIRAGLKNETLRETVLAHVPTYLASNYDQPYTVYIYLDWLKSGAAVETIESYIKLWVKSEQPDNHIKYVKKALFDRGIDGADWFETD